ncbi:ester cyclase [Microbacterium oleivorans]|uniref:Putative ester cyclase n=1 Tax=Microbacterium oleivorans TaxID=273677 RepID=A0A031FZK4_9MICO|nr:ester cyclase [Microbacterium oleivorans]EZP29646.1 putative ester cyclase [Microbacterium oleivorans]
MEPWELHGWFEDFLDACNRHDLEAVRDLLDAGVRRAHLPGGADAWIEDLADLFHGFPDWRWKSIQVVAEDDRIAAHVRGGGTHTGPWRGIAPTRRHVNVAEFLFLRLSGNRVVASTRSGDAEVLAQLTA